MPYVSLTSRSPAQYPHQITIAHIYGDLMNTYGDNGNVLMLKYVAEKLGAHVTVEVVTLGDNFDPHRYNVAFWGGGQDYEQAVIADQLSYVSPGLGTFMDAGKPLLAVCGGYQMLGQYFEDAQGKRYPGSGLLGHYSISAATAAAQAQAHGSEPAGQGQKTGSSRPQVAELKRLIGDVRIHCDWLDMDLYGFENHGSRTYLGQGMQGLGRTIMGHGNNGTDGTEGIRHLNTIGTYLHGPVLSRNVALAYHLVATALRQTYGQSLDIPAFEQVLAGEDKGQRVADTKRTISVT